MKTRVKEAEAHRFRTTESSLAEGSTEASQLGDEFASFIQQKAFECSLGMSQGLSAPKPKEIKDLRPKKSIFEDTRYVPALANTHICYEYDAQYKEMDHHWQKSGKKFLTSLVWAPNSSAHPMARRGHRSIHSFVSGNKRCLENNAK